MAFWMDGVKDIIQAEVGTANSGASEVDSNEIPELSGCSVYESNAMDKVP
jgi:hypothetical protein